METHTIPRGHWFDDDDFRTLVKQVMELRPRSWSLAEVERATAALGWELREPRTVGHRVWRRFAPRTGPSYGYGLLESDVSDPERIRRLNLSLIDLPDEGEDDVAVADRIRAAWWVMEDELGPPAMWGGYSGPWMLWRRTDVGDPRLAALPDLLLHAHDDGRMSLDLLPPGSDADAVGQASVRGRWYATEPSDQPPASAPTATALPPGTTWEDVEKRLAQALRTLGRGMPFLPGRFILHLGAAGDPQRFVQCWSQDLGLVIEATGFLHHPDAANPAQLTRDGWDFSRSIWQRRFPDAMKDYEHATIAARLLIGELRHIGVELADLSYDGTISGRGRGFHLELPDLLVPRVHQPASD
ncbi:MULTISPECIES: hypothetical protein [Streptomyces]|uniref:TY-Chap domain-containing protein n=1 Tax=Streptomyces TaxID=1883 RepID=UPI0005BC25ED|nr:MULTISPECIES: hypothetical protein [Streptomyces]MDP9951908.1 hypothetical protein [Streptomyces sp. DSM 41269]